MAANDTENTSCYDEMLAEVQALYDAGRDLEASEHADKLLGKMERQGLNDSLLYSEAMRLFGMAQYRMENYPMADGALRFAFETRNALGMGGDAVGIGILQTLSEIAILRDQPVEAASLLTLISQIIENNRTTFYRIENLTDERLIYIFS